jgi:hypothetical protein
MTFLNVKSLHATDSHCTYNLIRNGVTTDVRDPARFKRPSAPTRSGHRSASWLVLALFLALTGVALADFGGIAHPPRINGVSPAFGSGGTQVRITGTDLGFAQSIYFGFKPVPFSLQADGSVIVTAPYGVPGSTVPVTATDLVFGQTIPSAVTFSFTAVELDVTGPMPFSNDGDSAWFNGRGHQYENMLPAALVFNTPTPNFHVLGAFFDTGDPLVEPPNPLPHMIGNQGKFSATLQYCDVNQTADNPSVMCTDFSGNQGAWVEAPSGRQALTVDTAGPSRTAEGDITLASDGMFDEKHIARTLRIQTSLAQGDTNTAEGAKRFEADDSPPFDAAIVPSAILQLNLLPYTIVYHPPGNQSTASYALASTYGTSFKLGNTTTTSNKWSDTRGDSVKFAVKLALSDKQSGVGGSGGGNVASSLDQTMQSGFGVTDDTGSTGSSSVGIQSTYNRAADPTLAAPGNGDTCASPTDCSTVKHHSDTYWRAPFWQDEFILLVHPQFATWVLGNGEDRYVMLGAVPVTANVTVAELAACASGQRPYGQDPCRIDYTDNGISSAGGAPFAYVGQQHDIILSKEEAQNLLKLDPFYLHGQGAAVPTRRALPIESKSYGSKIGVPAQGAVELSVTNTEAQSSTTTATQTHTAATVTTVRGNSSSVGLSIATGLIGEDLTIDNKETSSLEQGTVLSYTQSTATSTQTVTTAKVSLNDVDNTQLLGSGGTCKPCHDPLPDRPNVTIFLDRIFGTFMFVDPNAPGVAPGCITGCEETVLAAAESALAALYQFKPLFTDVKDGGVVQSAVGILVRFGVMNGFADGTFRPNRPLTRGDLATVLQRGLQLSASQVPKAHNDRTEGGQRFGEALEHFFGRLFKIRPDADDDDPVSRQAFADSLGQAFHNSMARALQKRGNPPVQIPRDNQIAPWALDNVRLTVAAGYLDLGPMGDFRPHAPITRAEAAAALAAALKDR